MSLLLYMRDISHRCVGDSASKKAGCCSAAASGLWRLLLLLLHHCNTFSQQHNALTWAVRRNAKFLEGTSQ
jgi:hypothetical protein